jgi:hypothetical protein
MQGDDDVYVCKIASANKYSLDRYYNNRRTSINQKTNSGTSNISISYANNNLKCNFRRALKSNSLSNFRDLTQNSYYILLAYGSLTSSSLENKLLYVC